MKEMRKVLTSNGYQMIEVNVTPIKTAKVITEEIKEEETKEEITITADLINSMELNELKVIAKDNNIKLGNRGKEKARAFLIKELNLEEEVEL